MKMLSNFLQKAASFSGADLNQSFPARQSYARWNPLTWQRAMNEGTTTSRREQVRKNYEKHNFFLTGPRSQFSIPSSTQIKSELKRSSADVDPLYYGMVRELTNQASGGRSNPSSYWRGLDQLEEQRLSQGGYSTPGLTKEEFKNYLKNLQHLLESVNFKNIPGFNGLQKACALLKVLEQQSQKIKGRPLSRVLTNSETTTKCLDELLKPLKDLEAFSSVERYLLSDQKLSEQEQEAFNNGNGEQLHPGMEHSRSVTDQLLDQELIQRVAEVAGILKGFKQLRSSRSQPKAKSDLQTQKRYHPIASVDELAKLDPRSWALYLEDPSHFWYKVSNHELLIRDAKSDRKSSDKQALYLLVDASGSMDSHKRIGSALAVLLNRLEAVCLGNAELFYSFFDYGIYEEQSAKNISEARLAIKRIKTKNFSGGDTSIDKAIQGAVSRISKKSQLERPEIAIVTDGLDDVTIEKKDLQGATLHCFMCDNRNAKLEALAKSSGGVVLHL